MEEAEIQYICHQTEFVIGKLVTITGKKGQKYLSEKKN